MPTITLQVGQCGNQVGQQLWRAFDRQGAPGDAKANLAAGCVAGCDSEFFQETRDGERVARCLLVDTEPKVVQAMVGKQGRQLFERSRCFIGQSGRGNNWAFGYRHILPSQPSAPSEAAGGAAAAAAARSAAGAARHKEWDSSVMVQEPDAQETRMLQDVIDGIRLEAEASDTAPQFLLLHSLGGGSGSGLGSRLLEAIREEYALNHIASVSVAPRTAGDSPMQNLNSVMALSFLQAYSDVVMLFNNSDQLARANKLNKSAGISDVNHQIAQAVLGALWPLDAAEVAGANARIRDMVCTVAADPCLKLVEANTVPLSTALGTQGLWQDGFKALSHLMPRSDPVYANQPVVISSSLVLGRGLSGDALSGRSRALRPSPVLSTWESVVAGHTGAGRGAASSSSSSSTPAGMYVHAVGGAERFACPADALGSVACRHSPSQLVLQVGRRVSAGAADTAPRALGRSSSTGTDGGATGSSHTGQLGSGQASMPAITSVTSSSLVIGWLDGVCGKAASMTAAGAYLHWFERYGCSKAAVEEAIACMEDVADSYRLACGVREWL